MLGCAIVPRNSGLRRLQYDDCFYLWRTVLIRVALLRSALLPKTIKFRINVTLSSQPRTPASLHARTLRRARTVAGRETNRARASWNLSLGTTYITEPSLIRSFSHAILWSTSTQRNVLSRSRRHRGFMERY